MCYRARMLMHESNLTRLQAGNKLPTWVLLLSEYLLLSEINKVVARPLLAKLRGI